MLVLHKVAIVSEMKTNQEPGRTMPEELRGEDTACGFDANSPGTLKEL